MSSAKLMAIPLSSVSSCCSSAAIIRHGPELGGGLRLHPKVLLDLINLHQYSIMVWPMLPEKKFILAYGHWWDCWVMTATRRRRWSRDILAFLHKTKHWISFWRYNDKNGTNISNQFNKLISYEKLYITFTFNEYILNGKKK